MKPTPQTKLQELKAKAKELEKQMDAIVKADGKISDWQALRDELNILQNIKIPAEMNRQNPIPVGGYDVHIYKIPSYV